MLYFPKRRSILFIPAIFIVLLSLAAPYIPHTFTLVDEPTPDFSYPALSGEIVELSALRGEVVFLNFWATWCRPCVQEHGVLTAAASRYSGKVRFLGVVYEDTEERIRAFLKRSGAAYPTLIDEAGKTAIAYGVYGVPETFFIDAQGQILFKHAGPLNHQSIESYLRKLTGSTP